MLRYIDVVARPVSTQAHRRGGMPPILRWKTGFQMPTAGFAGPLGGLTRPSARGAVAHSRTTPTPSGLLGGIRSSVGLGSLGVGAFEPSFTSNT